MRVSGGEQDDSRHVSRSRKHSTLVARHLIQPWTSELWAASKWVRTGRSPNGRLCVCVRFSALTVNSTQNTLFIVFHCSIVLHEPALSLGPWLLLAHVWSYFHVFAHFGPWLFSPRVNPSFCRFSDPRGRSSGLGDSAVPARSCADQSCTNHSMYLLNPIESIESNRLIIN